LALSGDGGPAAQARIQGPRWLAFDAAGNLYVTEGTNRIRKITRDGIISTVCGQRNRGLERQGGSAPNASFNNHEGLTVDLNGNIYVADTGNGRLRKIQGSAPFRVTPNSPVFTAAFGGPVTSKSINLSSSDGSPRNFQVTASVPWLTVTPPAGVVSSKPTAVLSVAASTTGLTKGTYTGQVAMVDTSSGAVVQVPVTLTVSGTAQQLRLSQVGLTFAAIEGGPAPAAQTFQVLNTGTGIMSWNASAVTLSGGAGWLTATPASGSTIAGSPALAVGVTANPTGLTAGAYCGQINVTAAGADNSPQTAIVLLNVLPSNGKPGPQLNPSGLLYSTGVGSVPSGQSVQISNPSSHTINYTATARLTNGTGWLTAPAAGSLTAGQQKGIDIPVQPKARAAGVYRGTITFSFTRTT
jgi:hypothetical protein